MPPDGRSNQPRSACSASVRLMKGPKTGPSTGPISAHQKPSLSGSTWLARVICNFPLDKWLGHSSKVAAQHYLMSRDHHLEDVVCGGESSSSVGAVGVRGSQSECEAKCASIATRNATPQASASGSVQPHKTIEPAATIPVAAGSSVFAPVTKTGPCHEAAQKKPAGAMDGPAGVKKVAGQEPNNRGFVRKSRGA